MVDQVEQELVRLLATHLATRAIEQAGIPARDVTPSAVQAVVERLHGAIELGVQDELADVEEELLQFMSREER
jgi:hypothetical protein